MKAADKQLLSELSYGIISRATFFKRFSVDLKNDTDFIQTEIVTAIESQDFTEIEMTIPLIWLSTQPSNFVDLLKNC